MTYCVLAILTHVKMQLTTAMTANYSGIVYRPGIIISALLIGTVGPCNWSSASPLYKSYFDFVIPKDDSIFFKTK